MKITRLLAGLMACLCVQHAAAADPPKADKVKFGEWPPAKKAETPPPVTSDMPRTVSHKQFRMFWVENYKGTIPVRWTLTPVDTGAKANSEPIGNGDKAVGILEGDEEAKSHRPPEAAQAAVTVWGISNGRLLLQADGVEDGVIVTLFKVMIEVRGARPPTTPPTEPPTEPPTQPAETGYLMIVRPNGPASPEFAKIMLDPAWDELRAKGIEVKDKTLESIAGFYTMPPGVTLPTVVTLKINADRTKSREVVPRQSLPNTSEGIRKLGEALK